MRRWWIFGLGVLWASAGLGQVEVEVQLEPYPPAYVSEWESRSDILQVNVINNGAETLDLRGFLRIVGDEHGEVLTAWSKPFTVGPGEMQPLASEELIDYNTAQYDEALKSQILSTGRIPEDVYTVQIEIYSYQDGQQGELLAEGEAMGTVLTFSQPSLVSPMDGEVLPSRDVAFEWTASTEHPGFPVHYWLRIYEVNPPQTPFEATQANRTFYEKELVSEVSLVYPDDAPEFLVGRQYVWLVQALDEMGNPLGENDGMSEMWTFWYKIGGGQEVTEQLQQLVLLEGLARLEDLSGLQVQQVNDHYVFNGTATLNLEGLDTAPQLECTVQDLEVDLSDPDNPQILGGEIVAQASAEDLGLQFGGAPIQVTDVRFSNLDGLTVGLAFVNPLSGEPLPLQGRLELTSSGVSGSVESTSSPDAPLLILGEDAVQLRVTRVSVHFSDPEVTLEGSLVLFDQPSGCQPLNLEWQDGKLKTDVVCSPDLWVPLVPGSDLLKLHVVSVEGPLEVDPESGEITFDLNLQGAVAFRFDETWTEASVALHATPSAVEVTDFSVGGDFAHHPLDLGWLRLTWNDLNLQHLSWTAGNWDFAFGGTLQLDLPQFPNLDLPALENVSLDGDGFHLPQMSLDNLDLPPVEVGGFGLAIRSFEMPDVDFPWFSGGGAGDDWGFQLSCELSLPNLPALYPECIRTPGVTLEDISLNADGLSAELPPVSLQDCPIPLGGGAQLILKSLSGHFQTGSESYLTVEAQLHLPDVFECQGYEGPTASLKLYPNGLVEGSIEGLAPPCPFAFGGFQFSIENASVLLGVEGGQQSALLQMEGHLNLPGTSEGQTVTASGALRYDLLANRLVDGSVEVNDPFRLDLPSENPLFSFVIQHAVLDTAGLHVNGSYSLQVGTQSIPVNFQDLQFDPFEGRILNGSVAFAQNFSLKIVLEDGDLQWGVVPYQAEVSEPNALRIDLAGDLTLDPQGFHAAGQAAAFLKYNGQTLDELSVSFEGFTIGFDPLGVSSGRAVFSHDGVEVGQLTPDGFLPNLGFFAEATLPDQLPLPSAEMAYVVLREGGNLLVDVENVSNGIRIHTRPAQPVRLVFPSLQLSAPTPPEVELSFDAVFNPSNFELVSGNLHVEDIQIDLSQFGLPFDLERFDYQGQEFEFGGSLHLLDETLPGLTLRLGSNAHLSGSVSLPIGRAFPIVPDFVSVFIDSISGVLDVDLGGFPAFQLTASGRLDLSMGDGTTCPSPLTIVVSQDGFEVQGFSPSCDSLDLDLGWIRMVLKDLSFSKLAWSQDSGWDFGMDVDVNLAFPEWGITLPPIENVGWGEDGFHFPDVEFPDLENVVPAFDYLGFRFQPLAFRMPQFDLPWPDGGDNTDWGIHFDFQLDLPGLPESFPDCLKNPQLTILDAGYQNGHLTASVETKVIQEPGCPVPLGAVTLVVESLGGSFSVENGQQTGYVDFAAHLTLPEGFGCDQPVSLGQTHLRVTGEGLVIGTVENLVPPCPLSFGPFQIAVTQSQLSLGEDDGSQTAVLSMQGQVKLPGPDGGEVTANGSLVYDLIHNDLIQGSLVVDQPFRWDLPQQDPVLSFVVQHAELTDSGMTVTGGGSLQLGEGASVGVTFENLGLSFPDLRPVSGGASFHSNFALQITAEDGELHWAAVDTNAQLQSDVGILLKLPQVGIQNGKLVANGQSSVTIRYNGKDLTNVRAVFAEGFAVSFSPVGVDSGKVDFYVDDSHVAVLDRDGFLPLPGLLELMDIPARVPLPDSSLAYLEIKDSQGNLRVTAEKVNGGLHLAGNDIPLVVPALAYGGSTPQWNVSFDVVINPSDWSLVDGNLSVSAPAGQALLDLNSAGLPLRIVGLDYGEKGGKAAFLVSAELALPEAFNGASLRVDSLTFGAGGLSGTARLEPGEGQDYVLSWPVGDMLTVNFSSCEVTLGEFACTLTGDLVSSLFEGETMPFSASLSTDGLEVTADLSALGAISMGVAQFEPQPVGDSPAFHVEVGSDFELVLSGIFRVPSLNNMALTIQGLTVSSSGVSVQEMHLTAPQQFELYGSTFQITDIAFEYQNSVFYLILSGQMQFLEQTIAFQSLRVGSDGSFTLQGAFYEGELVVADPYLKITRIGLQGDSLRVEGSALLPEPLLQEPQSFAFSISPGGFSGEIKLKLIQEARQLDQNSGQDATELNFGGLGTLDLTYLGINLDLGDFSQSSVDAVVDFYLENNPNKRIGLGNVTGNQVDPGVHVRFDGSAPEWGPVSLPPNLSFELQGFSLELSSLSVPDGDSFGLLFSGSLSLGVDGVEGSIGFEGWGFTSEGLEVGTIQSGAFSVTDLLTISVNGITYNDSPTQIQVTKAQENSGNAPPDTSAETIDVNWSFEFGGGITLADLGGGQIQRFLVFESQSGGIGLVIQDAHVEVPDMLDLHVDLQYMDLPNGYKFLLAGSGSFGGSVQVGAVGKLASLNGQTSFGFFVLVGGAVRVPVGPGVVITGFGGGFFYHPDPADLALVKSLCKFSGAGQKINDPGKFAAFLYGTVAVVDDYAIKGAALLTFTENYFRLDAEVVLLNMDTYLNGTLALEVGLTKLYVTGDLAIKIKVSDLLKGEQQISIYYYGEDAWAVTGKVDLNILSFVTAQGSLFIGPPGFAVDLEISKKFDVVIVEVDAGLKGMAWYIEGVSWGGYFKAWIEAEVLGGVVSAKGWMEFAVLKKTEFYIYGLAGLSVSTIVYDWEGSVWAKITSGGDVDGGFGSDSEMERLIDEAKGAAEEMQQAKEDVENAMNEAKAASLALTPEQLQAAGVNAITQFSQAQKNNWLHTIEEASEAGGLTSTERTVLQGVVDNGFADYPNRQTAEANIESHRQQVEQQLNAMSQAIEQASGTLAGITVTIPNIEVGGDYDVGGSPVTVANLQAAEKDELSQADVQSLQFGVDPQQVSAQQATLTAAEADLEQLDKRIHEQIGQVWTQLMGLSNQLSQVSKQIGSEHRKTLHRMLVFYSTTLQYLHDLYWHYQNNLQYLNSAQNSLKQALQAKRDRLTVNELRENAKRRVEKAITLANLGTNSNNQQLNDALQAIDELSGNQLKQANYEAGLQLWYQIPVAGNQQLASTVLERRDQLAQDYKEKLDGLRQAMSQLEQALDQLYEMQSELTEIVYDLYDRLRYRNQRVVEAAGLDVSALVEKVQNHQFTRESGAVLAGGARSGVSGNNLGQTTPQIGGGITPVTPANTGALVAQTLNWRTTLLAALVRTEEDAVKMLHVPVMEDLNAAIYAVPWGAFVNVSYNASHPDKIVEYSFQVQPQGQSPDPAAWMTLGEEQYFQMLFTRPHWPENLILYVRARGSGGYTNARSVPISLQYGDWGEESTVTVVDENVDMSGDTTPPTTPTAEIPLFTSSGSEFPAHWEAQDDESGVVEYQYRVYRYTGTGDQFRSKYGAPMNQASINWAQMAFSGSLSNYGEVFSTLSGLTSGATISSGGLLAGASAVGATGVSSQFGTVSQVSGGSGPGMLLGGSGQVFGQGSSLAGGSNLFETLKVEWEPITDWLPGWGRTDVTIRHLQLEHDHAYRVGVKAVNGESLESEEGFSNPVVVDHTPPSAPVIINIEEKPHWVTAMLTAYVEPHYVPGAKFTWMPSSDVESGILTYQLAVSKEPLASWSAAQFTDVGKTTHAEFFGGSMVFVDTMWVNLVAVNQAGLVSDVFSVPFVVHDPSPPSAPQVQVDEWQPLDTQISFTVTAEAKDPETGVKGYQVALGTWPGGTNVLDWSWPTPVSAGKGASGEFGPVSKMGPMMPPNLKGMHVIEVGGLDLQTGVPYYLSVRAVNGDGDFGPPTGAGPFRVDTTPPLPLVADPEALDGVLKVHFSGVKDAESGVAEVEVQVRDKGGSTVKPWTTAGTEPGESFEWTAAFAAAPGDYVLRVRTRNRAGRLITQKFPFRKPDQSPPALQIESIPSAVRLAEFQPVVTATESETQVKRLQAAFSTSPHWVSLNWYTIADTLATSVQTVVRPDSADLRHGHAYTLFLRASNVDGIWGYKKGPHFTVIARPPSAPTSVTLEQLNRTTFRVSWQDREPLPAVSHYQLGLAQEKSTGPDKWKQVPKDKNAVALRLNLSPGTRLRAYVRIVNPLGEVGPAAASAPLQVSYMDDSPPSIAWLNLQVVGKRGKNVPQASWQVTDLGSGVESIVVELWARAAHDRFKQVVAPKALGPTASSYVWDNVQVKSSWKELKVVLKVTDRAGNTAQRSRILH